MRVLLLLFLNFEHKVLATGTTADRIQSFNYTSETHNVTTTDGYVLTLFRIINSTTLAKGIKVDVVRPVVLMMHGLVSSSDCWVINGPNNALAFNLADSGYDVWLGNGRGNPYANMHVSMSSKERAFWNFSWHEIGTIDLPLTIDYILKMTGQSSLHYVGHSQGTTVMFVLLSTQPEYNKKLKTSHMLAPIAYMKNARSKLFEYLTPLLGSYSLLDPLFGDLPFMQQHSLHAGTEICRSSSLTPNICSHILYTMGGGASDYLNNSLLRDIFNTHPASCSTHQAIHLIQLHKSGRFCQYDFGEKENQQRYNRTTPPYYEVANINPRYSLDFYYSDYDELSSKTDVEHLSSILGKKAVKHFIDLKNFAHIDFLWASNVKDVLNRRIVEKMNYVEMLLQRDEL